MALSYLIDATRGKGQYPLIAIALLLLSKVTGISFLWPAISFVRVRVRVTYLIPESKDRLFKGSGNIWLLLMGIDGPAGFPPYFLLDLRFWSKILLFIICWYPLLQPRVHYVSLRNDLSDILEMAKWAKANDIVAQIISQNGKSKRRVFLMCSERQKS